MKAPKWYHRDEIRKFFERRGMSYSPKELQIFTEELQKAFEKGWEKCLANHQRTKNYDIEPAPYEAYDFWSPK